jgi:hypothetical protein
MLALSFLTGAGGLLTNALAGESDPVVARVSGKPIRLSYVYQHIEALPLGDQIDVRDQLDRFTESVIKQEILFQYALHQLDEDVEFREEIKTIVMSHLIEKHVKSRIDVSDKLVEAYYRDHSGEISGEHWRVHQIPLKTGVQCEELRPRITSITSFVELARKYSIDPVLASRGGDLGYVMRHHNVLGLGEDLFTLPLHKTHRIDNQGGCHLIWISEYVKSPMPALAEVRDRIHQILVRQQEVSLLNTLLERASKGIVVKRYSSTNNAAQNTATSDASTTIQQN